MTSRTPGAWAAAISAALIAAPASAQAPVQAPATPVEIRADMLNGEVLCRPPRARLPARTMLDLRVQNPSPEAIWFIAPKFFEATEHLDSGGFAYDVKEGGFLVAPGGAVRVLLRSPAPGEYYYACHLPSTVPTARSSGFLIVVEAAGAG